MFPTVSCSVMHLRTAPPQSFSLPVGQAGSSCNLSNDWPRSARSSSFLSLLWEFFMILLFSLPFLPIFSLSLSEPCGIYNLYCKGEIYYCYFFYYYFQFVFCIIPLHLSDCGAHPVLEDYLRTVVSSDKGILCIERTSERILKTKAATGEGKY